NAGFYNWPKRATEEIARLNPEVDVFVIGTNDYLVPPPGSTAATTVPGASPDPAATTTTTPAWRTKYEALVEQMLATLIGNGRTIYWVGPPVLGDPQKEAGAQLVGEIARDVAARHPEVTYVDAHSLFADSTGHYTPYVERTDGRRVLARTDDGIHLTVD